ncbi:hypothetical protein DFH09DRAFT_1314164 [Mycena vulgaris]|nr:hypothetical protein DFH09DRAFT_1314164 [Mycena vulgaris]
MLMRRPKRMKERDGPSTTSVHTHHLTWDDLGPRAAERINEPIETCIERASEDQRRVYTEISYVPAPSPIKHRRREEQELVDEPTTAASPVPTDEIDELINEQYQMHFDSEGAPAQKKKGPKKGRGIFEPSMNEFHPLRGRILEELLRCEGCANVAIDVCPGCSGGAAHYRCKSCFGELLYCKIVQHWDGKCFAKVHLKELGLRIQFGHRGCVKPRAAPENFVVLHLDGIQEVAIDYCGCDQEFLRGEPHIQLLRRGWYPATTDQPQTAATFECLDFFHVQTLQAKTTMYDFYVALKKLTNNMGIKPPNRYSEFLRMTRQYRHLLMLKRAGRGHNPSGVYGMQPGECAVLCPACPRPGMNLPDGWENTAPKDRFLYIFFLVLNACFRLKRRLISSDLRDPGLWTGWAYFTETQGYRQFLLTVTDQKEMSTCSGLAALDYANTKFSRGYSSTGVGMGGDLQKGERFVNMDYIFASILRHIDPRLFKVISYDIVCQWWNQLKERLLCLPPLLCLRIALVWMCFVIPKMHIHSHTMACQLLFSLNFLVGAGQMDGEGIERPWANIGGVATSTREQGPGFRHNTLDDHWGYWNWVKLMLIARLLRHRLDTAKVESQLQSEGFEAFSAQQAEHVPGWLKIVADFEKDPSMKNPYETKIVGLTEAQVQLQFSEEEAKCIEMGIPALHNVSPSGFIYAGLELEEQQRRVRVQAELKKAGTSGQLITLTGLQTKLTRGIQCFRKLQAVYTPVALQAASRVASQAIEGPQVGKRELAEETPLFLPSALTEEERKTGCAPGLENIEALALDAQCRTSLVHLRNQLHVKSHLMIYKKRNSWNQGANMCSQTIVSRNESKIRLHSEKYQGAWHAIRRLNGGDLKMVGWLKLRQRDIWMMEDKEELTRRMERQRKQDLRRLERQWRLVEEGKIPAALPEEDEDEEGWEDEEGDDAGRREARGRECTSGTDADLEDALRIEWSKAYARSRRWKEEVWLLEEESRWILVSFEFSTFVWEQRALAINIETASEEFTKGVIAYAVAQARMFRAIKAQAEVTLTEPKLVNGRKRISRVRVEEDAEEEGEEGWEVAEEGDGEEWDGDGEW